MRIKNLLFTLTLTLFVGHLQAQLLGRLKNAASVVAPSSISSAGEEISSSNNESALESGKMVKDYGMTDNLHSKYIKKIVFSKSPIEFQKVNESKLTNEFKLGDHIYYMAYFERSIYNQTVTDKLIDFKTKPYKDGNYMASEVYTFSVNGMELVNNQPIEHRADIDRDYFLEYTGRCDPFKSIAERGQARYDATIGIKFNRLVVPHLKKGENIIKFSLGYKVRNFDQDSPVEVSGLAPMATGEFKIIVKDEAEIASYLKEWTELNHEEKMNDPAFTAQVLTMEKNRSKATPEKIIITSPDWEINQDGLIIKNRFIVYHAIYKTDNPKYLRVVNGVIEQSYQGGGQYGKSVMKDILDEQLTPAIIYN